MSNNEGEAYPDSQWRRAYLKLRRSKLIEEKQIPDQPQPEIKRNSTE
jgi:hypothetical protein